MPSTPPFDDVAKDAAMHDKTCHLPRPSQYVLRMWTHTCLNSCKIRSVDLCPGCWSQVKLQCNECLFSSSFPNSAPAPIYNTRALPPMPMVEQWHPAQSKFLSRSLAHSLSTPLSHSRIASLTKFHSFVPGYEVSGAAATTSTCFQWQPRLMNGRNSVVEIGENLILSGFFIDK